MSFKTFNLHFLILHLECSKKKQASLELGKIFNLEGDYNCTHELNVILSAINVIYLYLLT